MTSKFSTQSILETIATHVKEGATLEDVQNNAFYENAPIHDAEEATKEFDGLLNGKLGAIQRVRDFETAVCGEVCTDLSNPVSLANMMIFINSQTIMAKLAKKMGIGLDYELTKQQAAQLSNVDTMKKLLFNSSKKDTSKVAKIVANKVNNGVIDGLGVDPVEATRATYFGKIQNWDDNHFFINEVGNFESMNEYQFQKMLKNRADDIINQFKRENIYQYRSK